MRVSSVWNLLAAICCFSVANAWGWGAGAHKFVNSNAVMHLPPSMAQLAGQQSFLGEHASDADYRKSADTAEGPKHFLDLEMYPDFRNLPPDLGLLVTQYGWATVKANGLLPWATVWAYDSLTAQLRRRDWGKAYQTAADLGHYLADAQQPLHCTVNYDGAQTGNNGIHSRYETGMINFAQAQLTVVPGTVRYVSDPHTFILGYMVRANGFVDSIMQADNLAKAASGWTGSGQVSSTYYAALWQHTRHFTQPLLQEATVILASLWYSAWVDAGLNTTVVEGLSARTPFTLRQNYPNPFNPTTVVRFDFPGVRGQGPGASQVKLVVFDLLGREVAVLMNEKKEPGNYEVRFDASGLPSGTYLYRLQVEGNVETKKLTLVR
jgi:hypothetical protein